MGNGRPIRVAEGTIIVRGGMMKKFWICVVEGTVPKTSYRGHNSEGEARTEAARLATLPDNIGKRVYVASVFRFCIAREPAIEWHYL